jgi:hypothetical protein
VAAVVDDGDRDCPVILDRFRFGGGSDFLHIIQWSKPVSIAWGILVMLKQKEYEMWRRQLYSRLAFSFCLSCAMTAKVASSPARWPVAAVEVVALHGAQAGLDHHVRILQSELVDALAHDGEGLHDHFHRADGLLRIRLRRYSRR